MQHIFNQFLFQIVKKDNKTYREFYRRVSFWTEIVLLHYKIVPYIYIFTFYSLRNTFHLTYFHYYRLFDRERVSRTVLQVWKLLRMFSVFSKWLLMSQWHLTSKWPFTSLYYFKFEMFQTVLKRLKKSEKVWKSLENFRKVT